MNGNTYIYSDNLHITGDINKGTLSSGGTWTQQKRLNDYFCNERSESPSLFGC